MLMKKHQRVWRNYNIKKEGAVHLSRIDFDTSFKDILAGIQGDSFTNWVPFRIKKLDHLCLEKGIYVVIQKLIFFCVYRQS